MPSLPALPELLPMMVRFFAPWSLKGFDEILRFVGCMPESANHDGG